MNETDIKGIKSAWNLDDCCSHAETLSGEADRNALNLLGTCVLMLTVCVHLQGKSKKEILEALKSKLARHYKPSRKYSLLRMAGQVAKGLGLDESPEGEAMALVSSLAEAPKVSDAVGQCLVAIKQCYKIVTITELTAVLPQPKPRTKPLAAAAVSYTTDRQARSISSSKVADDIVEMGRALDEDELRATIDQLTKLLGDRRREAA